MLRRFFVARDIWQAVGEPFPGENAARGRLAGALAALEDQHVVRLAARLVNPGDERDQEHAADAGMVRRLIRADVSRKPVAEARLAVPFERLEVGLDGVIP